MEIKTAEEARAASYLVQSSDPRVTRFIEFTVAPQIDDAIADIKHEIAVDVHDELEAVVDAAIKVLQTLGYRTHIWMRQWRRMLVITW